MIATHPLAHAIIENPFHDPNCVGIIRWEKFLQWRVISYPHQGVDLFLFYCGDACDIQHFESDFVKKTNRIGESAVNIEDDALKMSRVYYADIRLHACWTFCFRSSREPSFSITSVAHLRRSASES